MFIGPESQAVLIVPCFSPAESVAVFLQTKRAARKSPLSCGKLPDRITLNNQGRRTLVRHGKKLGARIKELISIVSYSTFREWVRTLEDAPNKRPKAEDGNSGRPRV